MIGKRTNEYIIYIKSRQIEEATSMKRAHPFTQNTFYRLHRYLFVKYIFTLAYARMKQKKKQQQQQPSEYNEENVRLIDSN